MKRQSLKQEQQQNLYRKDFQLESNEISFTQTCYQEWKNSTKTVDLQAIDSQEFSEIDLNSSEYVQLQEDGFEMSDLLDKFDNIQKNNISKNIIKSFFSYLLDTKNNDLLIDFVQKGIQESEARKMVKNYYKSYGFNNNSLHKLIQHPKYGKAFEFYLTFEAEMWLAGSKVQQKETHLIYIDFLKLCCSNPKYSDHLVTYKKNKKSKYNNKI
ncbi:hypothetical protein ABPG74_015471 [Tetrahymena malaccensis]